MPKPKKRSLHEPLRRCAACRRAAPKRQLLRFARDPYTLQVQHDPTHQSPGRGAYLCPNPDCFRTALKRKSLERALKTQGVDPLLQAMLNAQPPVWYNSTDATRKTPRETQ
ncbi:MAG: hypothetical protein KatS3mg019_2476 [Fimbriimonadales bacterium]|nr:MAG: hypothetical protein KatS3mg019_2476 [Fimbriimonadales bacterium]